MTCETRSWKRAWANGSKRVPVCIPQHPPRHDHALTLFPSHLRCTEETRLIIQKFRSTLLRISLTLLLLSYLICKGNMRICQFRHWYEIIPWTQQLRPQKLRIVPWNILPTNIVRAPSLLHLGVNQPFNCWSTSNKTLLMKLSQVTKWSTLMVDIVLLSQVQQWLLTHFLEFTWIICI